MQRLHDADPRQFDGQSRSLRTPATVVTAGILRSDLGAVLARQAIASRNVLKRSGGQHVAGLGWIDILGTPVRRRSDVERE